MRDPLAFTAMFWEFISQVQVSKARVSDVGFESLLPRGEAPGVEALLGCVLPCQAGIYGKFGS